jgi:hypothetical protein
MGKAVKKLSARAVATIAQPGRHSDGDGLYLNVTRSGARSWLFMWKKDGKRREMGLGSAGSVSLARARELARECRTQVTAGLDPIEARDAAAEIKPEKPTFSAIAGALIAAKESEWRNEKHRAQWRASLMEFAAPLRSRPIDEIDTAAVLTVLTPLWQRGRKPPRDCASASRRFWTRPRRKAIDRRQPGGVARPPLAPLAEAREAYARPSCRDGLSGGSCFHRSVARLQRQRRSGARILYSDSDALGRNLWRAMV